MKQFIEFKKQRDFSAILSDTFGFIRNEFKPFFTIVLKITAPYLIMFMASMAVYTYIYGESFSFDLTDPDPFNAFDGLLLLITLLVYLLFFVLSYIFASSAILHYIKSYIDNNGNVNYEEIKFNVNKRFWGFLGLGILKGISIFIALLLCFLPVFYMIVPMTIVYSIYVFEKKSATDAYADSFSLIKDNFWACLGTIIVLGIIVVISSYVFAIPAAIYSILNTGVFSGEIDPANFNDIIDPVYIILNVLSTLFQFLLNFISIVGGALIYFNLNEKKNFTGTLARIESIGSKPE